MKSIYFLFLFLSLFAESPPQKKTICLNMIVKNESAVIERSLKTVKPIIDYWVICDTGSTDGTQEIIKQCLKDIPGELHETKWVNFSHNRNEALQAAKGKADYVFWMDADELLQYAPDFSLPPLDKDFYYMTLRQLKAVDIKRLALINNKLNWHWKGVLHEVLESPEAKTAGYLNGIINICNDESMVGGRSKIPAKEKYLQDAKVFEEALKEEPDNSRYAYYLGQSYLAAEEYDLAKKAFETRVLMESEDKQETYLAMYNLGITFEKMGNFDQALETFFKANALRPTRAEPLFRAAVIYRKQKNLLLGYLLSKYALTLPRPTLDVCLEYTTYDYGLLIEEANCALLLGKFDEGLQACCELLANPDLPPDLRKLVAANCEIARSKVCETKKQIFPNQLPQR